MDVVFGLVSSSSQQLACYHYHLSLSFATALKISEDRPTNYPDKLASRDHGFSIRDTLPVLKERLEVSELEPIFRPPR